jgi:hypothetical protein
MHLEYPPLAVRMPRMCFTHQVETKKKDQRLLKCIIRLMATLVQESNGTENTIGQLIKLNIGLAMENND